ncbi:winged helix-turn-helix domain-containing protein [Haliangium ochraceum]|uniref:ATPase associated with various cellular activities AAA_5 n=1 Tax=Haliangium ochraceum (strain DSM 14365 / JCM 11303 / SMP-2) TaxID=502025 RepID=D0LPM5_HALO1|nr:AAA family ATPase [Haliangium ochraceum]ACY15388.1 ATPase associated with various cellular activities AAA_5 [Haliangium ochraceum DSM 14365]
MGDDTQLAAVEATLADASNSQGAFYVPIVRAIAALGGRARRRDVIQELRRSLAGTLRPQQLDYLESKRRYGWARRDLKAAGIIGGERGFWELTELGRAYAAAHADDVIEIRLDIPDAKTPAPSNAELETVAATAPDGYELPLLEVLSDGVTDKDEFLARLHPRIEASLLPGDERLTRAETPVWKARAYWALSKLKSSGDVENIGTGQWAITNSGRARLARDRAAWDIRSFQRSNAKVRVEAPATASPPRPRSADDHWRQRWDGLRPQLSGSLFADLTARLRPDQGPTPEQRIARNLILYGPPGTGKTHLAKAIAKLLSGDEQAEEDERFRLVQFHPSYAYEDFVQGLRPDLKEAGLRYDLQPGPFLRIARDAEQDPDEFYVLVIDEINRGEPARIFGELMYALEYRDEPVALALGGELTVPSNLVVIGTMNSVDRSVALVDYALRRRFGFVRIDPDPDVIEAVRGDGVLAEAGPFVLEHFNTWLRARLGGEHVLGHSYFLTSAIADDADDAFERLWRLDIEPLLEEYFFGDEVGLASARKEWRQIVAKALEARAQVVADEEPTPDDAP